VFFNYNYCFRRNIIFVKNQLCNEQNKLLVWKDFMPDFVIEQGRRDKKKFIYCRAQTLAITAQNASFMQQRPNNKPPFLCVAVA